ncbi:MAG: phosphate/phosphite/phosphonate ABC transporter substrate-binding protein [Bdellovibrionales bacterium]
MQHSLKISFLKTTFILLSVFFFGLDQGRAETQPKKIRIGFIPGENPDKQRESALQLAKLIESRVGVPVEVRVPPKYPDLIEDMKKKEIDFAFYTAMTFVFAEKQAQAKVLLKKVWKEPFYYSVLIVDPKSKIKSIKDLKGKRIAFVDEKSTSGYLYPQVMFKKSKIDPKSYFKSIIYAGNHQAAIKALVKGEVDAATVFSDDRKGLSSAWTQYSGKPGTARILWVSEPIPNDPFCVRQDFYDKYPRLTHDVMFALIDLGMSGENKLLQLLGVQEVKLATTKQYEPVREMVREMDLKLEP